MATVTLKGNSIQTSGDLPKIGSNAPEFVMVKADLSDTTLVDYKGKNIVMNIFPSIDTGTCAASVRRFNQEASEMENTVVLCISRDLPFAQKRFCGAEGIDSVEMLSDFKAGTFGKDYGLELLNGPLAGLHARCVIVVNTEGLITHTELVAELVDEPNYDAAKASIG